MLSATGAAPAFSNASVQSKASHHSVPGQNRRMFLPCAKANALNVRSSYSRQGLSVRVHTLTRCGSTIQLAAVRARVLLDRSEPRGMQARSLYRLGRRAYCNNGYVSISIHTVSEWLIGLCHVLPSYLLGEQLTTVFKILRTRHDAYISKT